MICPHCKHSSFSIKTLSARLEAKECSACHGLWIPGHNYARFLEEGAPLSHESHAWRSVSGIDSSPGKKCPDCSKAVIARPVGHGLDFLVERCDHCFGIWLDAGEWQDLADKDLVGRIHHVFSRSWQAKVVREANTDRKRDEIRSLLPPQDAEVLIRAMAILNEHPQRDRLRTCLL